jgi:hypothetical protein
MTTHKTRTPSFRNRIVLPAFSAAMFAALATLPAGNVAAQTAAKDAGAPAPASAAAVTKADAGANSAPAAPATATPAGTADATDGGAPLAQGSGYQAPQQRKSSPPPPPPTPEQIAALTALQGQMDTYERGARDYRDTVTTIIKLHYESKKREILSGLDREIVIEKAELKKARDNAIAKLEEFIKTYDGPRAHPEATPDAMYRLAALYEERARSEDTNQPLEDGLKPAIALYKRVIAEYSGEPGNPKKPQYRELAGIYYFLGHAYNDAGRTDESQQVWRSLVCHNHFPYPTKADPDPKKLGHDFINPLPQDHDEPYWEAWRNRYPRPDSLKKGGADTRYEEVYPADCAPVTQPGLNAGDEPKYVAEVWWQIGNWEFDQQDLGSGVTKIESASVYGYNRGASAYLWAMKFKKPPLFGVSLYKYAWTLFKQQRYEAATKEFVHLLTYTDEQQKLTGDSGADFRSEAYTYIAGSLTNADFAGPGPDEPFITRPDIIDDPKMTPDMVEKKLHIAIDRVKDQNLIPQDKVWTIEIYKGLAGEFRSLNQFNNAIEVYQSILKKWPLDPTAPDVQNAIAETYDQLNQTKNKPGTPEFDAVAAKALEARTNLANYIGNTPWTDANKDNPAALQNAERLVRGGLRQAAATHTNNGKAQLVAAADTGDLSRQVDLLSRALSEYKLAALGWQGYLKQDENAPDAYESRYWLADARRQVVRIEVVLHKLQPAKWQEPVKKDIDDAMAAAIEVRDSNEDDKYLDNAAFFVVDVSDVDRDLAYQRYEDKGLNGIQKRDAVKFDTDDVSTRKVISDPVPPVVLFGIQARDEYVQRVPPSLDSAHHGIEYQFYAAETYFLYGQFDQARQRFEPIWTEHCGKDEYGFKAWEKLITMSNLSRDSARSTELAQKEKDHTCAYNASQAGAAGVLVNPTLQEAAYINARKKFEQACEVPVGTGACKNPGDPAKKQTWGEAAGLYEAALSAAPGRDEAPEAAMNAAYAYKQIGDFNKAIELYNKFISAYGSEENLNKLQKGDAKAKVGPDPKKYAQRLQYLNDAYDALGSTYYGFFNYQRAAETFDKVASNERFAPDKRKTMAKNAMAIFASMGQRDKMEGEYRIFSRLSPNSEEKVNADYLRADYDHKQWNPQGAISGPNSATRAAATSALIQFYNANKSSPSGAKYVVEAAYNVAKMMQSVQDPTWHLWFHNTIVAWDAFKKAAPEKANTPPYSDYAAEADFILLDEQIRANYDTPESRHKYAGAVNDIVGGVDAQGKQLPKGAFQKNVDLADKWDKELDRIVHTYQSLEWVPAAYARRGQIYDTLRTGLYNVVPPALKYFTPAEDAFLKKLENSGRDDLAEKADAVRTAKKEFWRSKKDQELSGADQLMIRHYASAKKLATKYNVRNTYVQKAISRLAYFTDILGDDKLNTYVTSSADPTDPSRKMTYSPGEFVQTRPGLTSVPPANGSAIPLPAAP